MSQNPDWQAWITWSQPVAVPKLVQNMSGIPRFPGFYAFSTDAGPLNKGNVLYIGETARIGGLRARLRPYLIEDPEETRIRHKGGLFILAHRLQNIRSRAANPGFSGQIYLRWAPFDTDKQTRRKLEAAMMQYYLARYNHRDMQADTPFDTI